MSEVKESSDRTLWAKWTNRGKFWNSSRATRLVELVFMAGVGVVIGVTGITEKDWFPWF